MNNYGDDFWFPRSVKFCLLAMVEAGSNCLNEGKNQKLVAQNVDGDEIGNSELLLLQKVIRQKCI